MSVENGYIAVENNSIGGGGAAGQRIENIIDLWGKELTFSVLLYDGTLVSGTNTAPEKGVSDYTSRYFYVDISDSNISLFVQALGGSLQAVIQPQNDAILKIVAAKLEFGAIQTLARKEGNRWILKDAPPNPALELLKCQRYLQPIYYGGSYGGGDIGIPGTLGKYTNGKWGASCPIRLITQMRAKPTVISDYMSPNSGRVVAVNTSGTSNKQGTISEIIVYAYDSINIVLFFCVEDDLSGYNTGLMGAEVDGYNRSGVLLLSAEL